MCASLLLVECPEAVSDRVGGHSQDGRCDAGGLVGHAHGVELSGDLLRGQLLGEVLHAADVVLRIGLTGDAVQLQVAVDAELHGGRLHVDRGTLQVGLHAGVRSLALLAAFVDVLGEVVVDLQRLGQLAVHAAHATLHEGRREV